MFTLALGLLGIIIGSFLNVLILRHGIRPLTGRSSCPSCGKTILWYDLIPVVSWIVLAGHCRECRAPISLQYPLVEGATALAFALIGAAPLPLFPQLLALPIAALLIAITVYDFQHTIIPDPWVYSAGVLALIAAFAESYGAGGIGAVSEVALAGPLVALPLFLLWLVSGGSWMGLGDVKLALVLGWLLGIFSGLSALFLAFILGAAFALPMLLFSSPAWKRAVERFTPTHASLGMRWGFTMKSEIPFGPFLIAGCFAVWFAEMYGIALPHFLLI